MIILEGLDRCGKTTVAMALRKVMPGWAYRHHTKPPVRAYHYFNWGLAHARPRVIVDRLHWSDVAYGPVCRNETGLTFHEWRLTELALLALRAKVLYLYDDLERVKGRWGADEMWDVSVAGQVYEAYSNLVSGIPLVTDRAFNGKEHQVAYYHSNLPVVDRNMRDLITRGGVPTDELMDLARSFESEAWFADQFDQPACGIGYLGPDGFLIIGEAPADGPHTNGNLGPNYPWDFGPAADWLWKALDIAQINWAQGYYTNAQTIGNRASLIMLTGMLKPKVVITLGKQARELLDQAECRDYLSLNHPQWERRFNHAGLDQYASQFSQALSEFVDPATIGGGIYD